MLVQILVKILLDCMANQGDCTGIDRGLCCGCQDDTQCSGSLGCGMLDPNKCCYSRPAVSIKSPTGTDVCLNTAIVVKFNQEMDINSLNKNNIKVSNSPGCNKDAVAEWITGMIINLLRNLTFYIGNNDLPKGKAPEGTMGLVDRKVLIMGKGSIGARVGEICTALKMNVDYFERDDLPQRGKNVIEIINKHLGKELK